jgi:hypothetical protein
LLLESEYKVKTKIIQIDFSGGHGIYEPIGKELEGFEIGVLGIPLALCVLLLPSKMSDMSDRVG